MAWSAEITGFNEKSCTVTWKTKNNEHIWHRFYNDGPTWRYTRNDATQWERKKYTKKKYVRKLNCLLNQRRRLESTLRDVLVRSEKALNAGRLDSLAKTMQEGIDAASPTQKSTAIIQRWEDLPLASEATEENLEWIASERIPSKQVTVIAAHKDSYKSMLMLRLAKAVTTGGDFLGRNTKRRRVLYLNREMPKAVFDSYCNTLRLDKSNRRFRILSSMWNTGVQPPAPGDELLRRFAKRYKPLIILDSLIRFFDGKMEDPKAINNFMENLNRLAADGATVIVLHHLPKHDAKSEGYGSVYILNGADFGWRITVEGEKYGPEERKVLQMQNTKTKMGDYLSIRLKPQLKSTGDFKLLGEHSEWREAWDRDVEKLKSLFTRNQWRERRKARIEAMNEGMTRSRFVELFDSCVANGVIRVKKGSRGLKKCRLT